MKARINGLGILEIERAGKMVEQRCPFATVERGQQFTCGEWCPHFQGPFYQMVKICHGTALYFDEITDERGR